MAAICINAHLESASWERKVTKCVKVITWVKPTWAKANITQLDERKNFT